jgi:Flp pilus assembly protein TadD
MATRSVRAFGVFLAAWRLCATDPEAATETAQATALAQSGKYDTAIQHYQKAIRLDSHLPGV